MAYFQVAHVKSLNYEVIRMRASLSQLYRWIINFAKIIHHNKHVDDIINKFHFRPPCLIKVNQFAFNIGNEVFFCFNRQKTHTTR